MFRFLALALLLLAAACKPEGGVKLVYKDGAPAKQVVERRLKKLMIRTAHVETEGADLAVYLPGGRRLEDAKQSLATRALLDLSFVIEAQTLPHEENPLPDGVTLGVDAFADGRSVFLEGASRQAVDAEAALRWPDTRRVVSPSERGFRSWLLDPKPVVTWEDIERASDSVDANSRPQVELALNEAGKKEFAKRTAEGVRRRMAIILDSEVLSAPMVMEPIPHGYARIALGKNGTLVQARTVATALMAGPLPMDLVLVSEAPYAPRTW